MEVVRGADPLVSVIMAARNAEETIRAAIESVCRQEYQHWELVVVDDASTDRTAAVAAEFSCDPRVRVVRMDSARGAAAARNRGIAMSRGSYIAVADADDLNRPQRILRQLKEFEQDEKLVALGAQCDEFGGWGRRTSRVRFPTNELEIRRALARGKMPIAHPTLVIRREAILQAGGYDEVCSRAEDLALLLAMGRAKMRALPDVLVDYRTRRRVGFGYVWRETRWQMIAVRRHGWQTSYPNADSSLNWLDYARCLLLSAKNWVLRVVHEYAAKG